MKGIATVLLIAALVLAWLLSEAGSKNSQLQSQITELNSKLNDKSALENLELQEKCSLRVTKVMNHPNYAHPVQSGVNVYREQQSHYNGKLKKCFAVIRGNTTDKSASDYSSFTSWLIDAYEERTYASYIWAASTATDKKNFMLQPTVCTLTHSLSNERRCQSYKEYEAFVALYME